MSLPQNRTQGKTNLDLDGRDLDLDRRGEVQTFDVRARCGVITGVGRSAVAVVAIDGPDALSIVMRCFRAAGRQAFAPGQVRFGMWVGPAAGDAPGESVIVTPLAEGGAEVHCHGGPAATARIVADLRACGAVGMEPHPGNVETTPLLIREARDVLARCTTTRTAAIALDQVRGAMQDWTMQSLRRHAASEESLAAIHAQAEAMLRFAPLGLHLTRPFRVVLLGPPNVGKSSLINAIVGFDRSITDHAAGTTRDVLHAETVIDGWPVRVSDTAGIRTTLEPIEREGVLRAQSEAENADLLLLVTEPAQIGPVEIGPECIGPEPISMDGFHAIDVEAEPRPPVPMIRVLNKLDLCRTPLDARAARGNGRSEEELARFHAFDLTTSALTGEGIPRLMESIASRLAQAVPAAGSPVPVTERQAIALQGVLEARTCRQLRDALHSLLGSESTIEESCVEES